MLTLTGRTQQAREALTDLGAFLDEVNPLTPRGQSLLMSIAPATWLGDFERAAGSLSRWIGRARESGSLAFLGAPQAFGAELDFRRGRWKEAEARGAEAVRALDETGQRGPLCFALVTLATIEAGLGRADDCRANARRAGELAEELGRGSIAIYHGFALGLLEQGLGRPAAAAAHLEPLVNLTRDAGYGEPAIVMWQPELVEAYARLGRLADARGALATLADQAERTEGAWARAATRRCRGLIDDDIDRHFGEALALHEGLPMPFERARTELLYGARLRRAGRRAEARAQLGAALTTFHELGAVPWAAQAREEIAASGMPLRPGAGPAPPPSCRHGSSRWRGPWPRASPTARRPRGCSCRRRPSSATWAACTASSACARAPSSRGSSPARTTAPREPGGGDLPASAGTAPIISSMSQ